MLSAENFTQSAKHNDIGCYFSFSVNQAVLQRTNKIRNIKVIDTSERFCCHFAKGDNFCRQEIASLVL